MTSVSVTAEVSRAAQLIFWGKIDQKSRPQKPCDGQGEPLRAKGVTQLTAPGTTNPLFAVAPALSPTSHLSSLSSARPPAFRREWRRPQEDARKVATIVSRKIMTAVSSEAWVMTLSFCPKRSHQRRRPSRPEWEQGGKKRKVVPVRAAKSCTSAGISRYGACFSRQHVCASERCSRPPLLERSLPRCWRQWKTNVAAQEESKTGLASAAMITADQFAELARLSRRQIDRLRRRRPLGFPREYELGSGGSKYRRCPRFKFVEVQRWLDSRALW
jgi:hypothetical protein